jgi:putative endonuclease
MTEKQDLGKKGEELALKHLLSKSYQLVYTNWRFGKDEVDIIVSQSNFVVFVEVKTRTNNYFGEPQEFVTKPKQTFMKRAANAYIEKYKEEKEVRFDVISIILNQKETTINHIENAFNSTG